MVLIIKRVFIKVLLKHFSTDQPKSKKSKKFLPYAHHCLLPPALPRTDVLSLPLIEPLTPLLVVFRANGLAIRLELLIRRRRAGGASASISSPVPGLPASARALARRARVRFSSSTC
jgi:hypothetical protein